MIVAKTRLKEKPKTCRQCIFRITDPQNGEDICRITRAFCPWEKKPNGLFGLGKPDWCPLMDEKELSGNSGQVVEIIQCKDCIGQSTWFKDAENGCEVCGMSGMYPKGKFDSCSYGDRRKK